VGIGSLTAFLIATVGMTVLGTAHAKYIPEIFPSVLIEPVWEESTQAA